MSLLRTENLAVDDGTIYPAAHRVFTIPNGRKVTAGKSRPVTTNTVL
jgi:hypothetical protein